MTLGCWCAHNRTISPSTVSKEITSAVTKTMSLTESVLYVLDFVSKLTS